MKIYKVALHELDELIKSDVYKQLQIKPITPLRAASYLRNPRAQPSDYVLYFMRKGSKLIAFRSLFADQLTGEKEQFAWLSGNWVHPDFRRQGHSEKLLEEAYSDWGGRLMFTNYAPSSLQLYLKSEKFKPIYSDSGSRFYLFAKPSKLLKERVKGLQFLLRIADFFVSVFASTKVKTFKIEEIDHTKAEMIERPDQECYKLLKESSKQFLFKRNKKSLKWVFSNPWVSTADKRFQKNYPFSSFSDSFKYHTLKLYSDGEFKGFVLYSIRDGHLKTLYHVLNESVKEIAAKHLINLAATKKLELLTILDSDLSQVIKSCEHPFIHVKNIEHRIYSSFDSVGIHDKIQSGDGDFVFS